jgi:hypothetical protein
MWHFLEFSFDFWSFYFWKKGMNVRQTLFLFLKHFPPQKEKENPHWKTGYKLEQYLYASIFHWGCPQNMYRFILGPEKTGTLLSSALDF